MILYCDAYWNDFEKVLPHIVNRESLYGKSVLITGAGGLICSTVCDLLLYLNRVCRAGIKLYLAGRSQERLEKRFYKFKEGLDWYFISYDAKTDFSCDKSFDFIIHGAGYGDPKGIMKEPVETMLCNFYGTYNLLDFLRKEKKGRLLFISSSEIYGKKSGAEPYRENDYGFIDLLLPRSSYPCSKRAAETLCASFCMEYGVGALVARPGHIYGPQLTNSDSRVSSDFIRKAKNGEALELHSAGSQMRSYTYSLDCASAILTILINGENGASYNISNKEAICSIRQFAKCVAETAEVLLLCQKEDSNEKKNWNAMDNSSLDSAKLEELGWKGCFSVSDGVKSSLLFYEVEK